MVNTRGNAVGVGEGNGVGVAVEATTTVGVSVSWGVAPAGRLQADRPNKINITARKAANEGFFKKAGITISSEKDGLIITPV
jgi:hypothetical protein